MIYPQMGNRQTRRVVVPELSGGLNVSKAITEVDDNQLTDCNNMWYKDGFLQTRPGIWCNNVSKWKSLINSGSEVVYNNKKHVIMYTQDNNYFKMFLANNDGLVKSFEYNLNEGTLVSAAFAPHISASTQYIYVYMTYEHNSHDEYIVLRADLSSDNSALLNINDSEYYVPTVLVNNDMLNDSRVHGTAFEGYNLLNAKYKVLCTTRDDTAEQQYDSVYMPTEQKRGVDILLEYTTVKWGTQTVTLTEDESWVGSSNGMWYGEVAAKKNGSGEVVANYKNLEALFSNAYNSNYSCLTVAASKTSSGGEGIGAGNGSSNMSVTMTAPNWDDNIGSVCKNTMSIWFGGQTGGLNSGSYLFMAGAEPNKMIWSDVNNPLYFPENNYVYIGSDGDKITRLAKMGNVLIVFKKHSTYCVTYGEGGGVTVDQLISGAVIDVTAYSATFPIAMISDSVGCDLPNTVQLCRNRLVFANTNGKVYEIVTQSITNERNIFEVSKNIEKLLTNEIKTIKSYTSNCDIYSEASAVDWNGYYILSFGGKAIFVMDYETYGFANIYSYSKTEDAQNRIDWYKWSAEFDIKNLYCTDGKLGALTKGINTQAENQNTLIWVCNISDEKDHDSYCLNENGITRDIVDIPCSFATKAFTFGLPEIYKRIEQIYFGAGSTVGNEIKLSFITHRGMTGERTITLTPSESYNADYIKEIRELVMQNRVRLFGIKVSSYGQFAFDGFTINWKTTGGVR